MAFIHYTGPGGKKLPLRGRMAFVLYWENGADDRRMHPVGLTGEDFSPQPGESSGLVQFRFDTAAAQLDADALKRSGGLQWRLGHDDWRTPYMRRGGDYYFAPQGDWRMRGINQAAVDDRGMTFRLRMSIEGKGDCWISVDHATGSIRMRDSDNDRARLAVHAEAKSFRRDFGSRFRPPSLDQWR